MLSRQRLNSVWRCRDPTNENSSGVKSYNTNITNGFGLANRNSSHRLSNGHLRQKDGLLFIALIGMVSFLQQQNVFADDRFFFLGTWPTQTLQQLQEAIISPFGMLMGKTDQQEQLTVQSYGRPPGALVPLQQQPVHNREPSVGGLQQHLDSVSAPEQAARNASAAAERIIHVVHMLSRSVADFVAALPQQDALHPQLQQYTQHPQRQWEPHECLQPHAFAVSVLRSLQEQQIEETLKNARYALERLSAPGYEEPTVEPPLESTNVWMGTIKMQHNAIEQPITPLFDIPAPLGSLQKDNAAHQPFIAEHREKQRAELEELLNARIAQVEQSRSEAAAIEELLQQAFQWSDACAMEAIGRLNQEVDSLSEAVKHLLRDDGAFAIAASSALKRLLELLEDKQTMKQVLADANTALKKVLPEVLEQLQNMHSQLQQRRLPVLEDLKRTRKRLALLVDAAAGIARSGSTDAVSYGGPFCQRLVQQWKRLQPPNFEGKLLLAQQLHHEKVIENMKDLAKSLQTFLASAMPADNSEGAAKLQQPEQPFAVAAQQFFERKRELDLLVEAATALRGRALQLASAIHLAMKTLQRQGASAGLFSLPKLEAPPPHVFALSPLALIESMQTVQQQAEVQLKGLVFAAKGLEEMASGDSPAAGAASATARLRRQDAELGQGQAEAAAPTVEVPVEGLKEQGQEQEQLMDTLDEDGEGSTAAERATDAVDTPLSFEDVPAPEDADEAAQDADEAAQDEIADELEVGAVAEAPTTDLSADFTDDSSSVAVNTPAISLRDTYKTLIVNLKDQLTEAAIVYGKAHQLITAAIVACASREKLESLHFKEREKQELRLVAEGSREHLRQLIKKQAVTLSRLVEAGLKVVPED